MIPYLTRWYRLKKWVLDNFIVKENLGVLYRLMWNQYQIEGRWYLNITNLVYTFTNNLFHPNILITHSGKYYD